MIKNSSRIGYVGPWRTILWQISGGCLSHERKFSTRNTHIITHIILLLVFWVTRWQDVDTWSEVTKKISLQENLTNEGCYVCWCIVLCLCYYFKLYLYMCSKENRELCHSFHSHSYIRKSLNHFHSCLSKDKKLFSAMNFPRTRLIRYNATK